MADRWITINGSHVLVGHDGKVKGGAGGVFNGKQFDKKLTKPLVANRADKWKTSFDKRK